MVVLTLLEWVTIGGCGLAVIAVAGTFVVSLAGEFRRAPATTWQPGGEWYPQTPAAATAPLGTLPESVEIELARMWAILGPDRPA